MGSVNVNTGQDGDEMDEDLAEATHERLRVAVIGLGAMGLPMAVRLSTALEVVCFDPEPERAGKARAEGVGIAESLRDAVEGADVVLLAVRTLAQAGEALYGTGGAGERLGSGAIVALTSTVGVPGAQHLAERLASGGQRLLDMPLSGGPARARAGDLLVFVGAPPATVSDARAVLDLLASTVAIVGPNPGDGQALKTVNQLLCGVHIAAAAEALALAKSLGLDPAAALAALGAGAAASFMLANRGPRIVQALQGQSPEVLSRVDIFVKDMGIVTEAGRTAGIALPVASSAEQVYLLGQAAGLGAADDSSVVTLLGGTARATEGGEAAVN